MDIALSLEGKSQKFVQLSFALLLSLMIMLMPMTARGADSSSGGSTPQTLGAVEFPADPTDFVGWVEGACRIGLRAFVDTNIPNLILQIEQLLANLDSMLNVVVQWTTGDVDVAADCVADLDIDIDIGGIDGLGDALAECMGGFDFELPRFDASCGLDSLLDFDIDFPSGAIQGILDCYADINITPPTIDLETALGNVINIVAQIRALIDTLHLSFGVDFQNMITWLAHFCQLYNTGAVSLEGSSHISAVEVVKAQRGDTVRVVDNHPLPGVPVTGVRMCLENQRESFTQCGIAHEYTDRDPPVWYRSFCLGCGRRDIPAGPYTAYTLYTDGTRTPLGNFTVRRQDP